MPREEGACKAALRAFAITFPPLKIALYINDAICYLFGKLIDALKYLVNLAFRLFKYLLVLVLNLVRSACGWLLKRLLRFQFIRKLTESRPFQQLELVDAGGPLPYANNLLKRLFTYHGGLLLALALYAFVYFVLVSHHTYLKVSIALVVLIVYLVLIENSHTVRSVLMLCLPIMLTNRGRALVYCSMFALMAAGPVRTLKENVHELHSSLTCCKQYLILSGDRHVDENYVKRLVRVEDVVLDFVENIKQYARELKREFASIIELAIACEQFIINSVELLKDIVNVCNTHSKDMHQNCIRRVVALKQQCSLLFNPFRFNLCSAAGRLDDVCAPSSLPNKLCELPAQVVAYIDRTIGAQLRRYIQEIENEFYVDIDIERKYSYNLTKSKSFTQVTSEIKFDVEQKFWYVRLIGRLFHLITLALVVFILATAAVYHMHYQTDLAHDNMYLDASLLQIDAQRQLKAAARKRPAATADLVSIEDETRGSLSVRRNVDANNNFQISWNKNSLDDDEDDDDADERQLLAARSRDDDYDDDDNDDRRSIIDEFDPLAGGRRSNESYNDDNDQPATASGALEQVRNRQTLGASLRPAVEQELGLDGPHGARRQPGARGQASSEQLAIDEATNAESLFPLSRRHERHYLRPASWTMNHVERSKLKWSSLVWLIIIGYIWFFVLLDYALYSLVSFLVEVLRDILFTSDLPLVDLETKSNEQPIVRYNRTYLNSLREQQAAKLRPPASGAHLSAGGFERNSSIQAFYRRLADSIERDIPDDVTILSSLENCLPRAHTPDYGAHKALLGLALFTFVAVIVEAYALRTRHCIANLYYPHRARLRSVWLYKKLLAERAKFEDEPDEEALIKFQANQTS